MSVTNTGEHNTSSLHSRPLPASLSSLTFTSSIKQTCPGKKKIYKLVWLWKWNKDHVQWKIFFARTTVIRSNRTQHCGYSVTFCKDDWDSVSIKIFASSFTFWFELSGREFLPLPAHCTIPTLSFTSFCGNELVSVSCFFFVFFFFKPETLPPWSVPCWLLCQRL